MTKNPLDEIEERTKKATAGPWEAHLGHGAWMIQDDSCDDIATVHDRMGIDEDPQAEANAAFIINAREDVPLLAGVIRGVEALHWVQHHNNKPSTCHADGRRYPCPTVVNIREALG